MGIDAGGLWNKVSIELRTYFIDRYLHIAQEKETISCSEWKLNKQEMC